MILTHNNNQMRNIVNNNQKKNQQNLDKIMKKDNHIKKDNKDNQDNNDNQDNRDNLNNNLFSKNTVSTYSLLFDSLKTIKIIGRSFIAIIELIMAYFDIR
jgi:hypothetical protein